MKIKYYGTSWENGMSLVAKVFDYTGTQVHIDFPMTETAVNSAIYISTDEIGKTAYPLTKGVYSSYIEASDGSRRGFAEFVWDGKRELTLQQVSDALWTEIEKMQIRDAVGIDGDKMVARGGQLQKKSEAPYNNTVDTNNIDSNDL